MTYKNKKKLFRKNVFKILSKKKINWYKKDKILTKALYKHLTSIKAKNIMLFIPLKNEANISLLIKQLRQKGINLYVPFIQGKSFKLVKYRLPLHKKKFGVKEPNISNLKIKKIDISLIPVIGVDVNCKRVGFGKGMYDRFFQKYNEIIKKRVFIQRELFICQDSICDFYDIKADAIFTTSIYLIKV